MIRRCCVLIALAFVLDTRAAEAQCTYSVSPASVSLTSIASASALSVITGSSCSWTATSTASWITITFVTGQGLGQVQYSVAANTTTGVRTGSIIVAGQTVTFTQAAASCTYTVTPSSVTVAPIASASALSVVTGSSCSWTATSTVSWITVTSATGLGIGQVQYTVAANTGTVARTGAILVAGQTITFTQSTQSAGQPPAAPTNLRVIG
jgi:all-beta uncharacterized protein/BACON domain-containing protein